MQFYLLAVLFFALLVAIFAIQNAVPVDIQFLSWRFPEISLVLVILGSLVTGALFAFVLGLFRQASLGRRLRHYQARNRELTDELARIRGAALEDTRPLGAAGRDGLAGKGPE